MNLTYYGHACFGLKTGNVNLLFDPFITPNPKAAGIDIDKIEADYILISHGHEDHIADVASIAKRTNATLVSNFEIISWFASQGLTKGHPMNHGGGWSFDFGRITYVNAIHSSMMPDGAYGGNPGGFVVQTGENCVYYAGDTALHMDMKLLKDKFDIHLAVLPIGDNFTMGYVDAARAASFVGCHEVVGVHYDTFGYIEIDHQAAIQHFKKAGHNLLLPAIGQSISI